MEYIPKVGDVVTLLEDGCSYTLTYVEKNYNWSGGYCVKISNNALYGIDQFAPCKEHKVRTLLNKLK